MDTHGMKEELSLINWTSVLKGSVDECLERFKSVLLKLRDKFVPASVVKSKGKVPWMSYKAAKLVRKKHRWLSRSTRRIIGFVKGHRE